MTEAAVAAGAGPAWRWRRKFAPNDRRVAAKAAYVDGQLARIAAQGQTAAVKLTRLNEAKSRFIESARLDTSSPDPYLGQARINAYEMRDFEALLVNIAEAEQRGYVAAGASVRKWEMATVQGRSGLRSGGPQRLGRGPAAFLEQAAWDYESCVTRSRASPTISGPRNLAYCQRRSGVVKRRSRSWTSSWTSRSVRCGS